MCGIVGIIKKNREDFVSVDRLKKSTRTLIHRGPDNEGYYTYKNYGLGHRRLKIIDLNSGFQPMKDINNGNVIIFNGEIYNYIEVRENLSKKGFEFHTESDTEVILKAYSFWGENCVNYFNGMWAFAILNQKKDQVFISRDRVGEKSLFYYQDSNELIFASEIKAITDYIEDPQINIDFFQAYLINLNVPAPYTFYKDIYQLEPAHNMIYENGCVKISNYWELPNVDCNDLIKDKGKVLSSFEEIFEDSVRIRMRSDVASGAFLSGGLDSSLIVSVMNKFSQKNVHTFTMGFSDEKFDETDLARLVANKFQTTHIESKVNLSKIQNPVKTILKYFDQPFGDSSAIPTYYVSKEARKHVTMVLTGDGGDEVLSGYKTYKKIELLNTINKSPKFLTKFMKNTLSLLNNSIGGNSINQLYSLLNNTHKGFSDINLNNRISPLNYNQIHEFVQDNYKESNQFSIIDYYNGIINSSINKDSFYQQMRLNFYNDLPNDYLVKVDRMSMANSLETRTPFLDYRLIELLSVTDKKIKLENYKLKSIIKNSNIGKELPAQILKGKKSGFSIPLKGFNSTYTNENSFSTNLNSLYNEIRKENKQSKVDENLAWALIVFSDFMNNKV